MGLGAVWRGRSDHGHTCHGLPVPWGLSEVAATTSMCLLTGEAGRDRQDFLCSPLGVGP